MESAALCLSYYRPLSMLLNSPTSTVCMQQRATKLRPSRSSLPLSSGSRRRPLVHVISPVIRASGSPPTPTENGKDDNEVDKGSVGSSLFLACALGVLSCIPCKMNPRAVAGLMEMYQNAPPVAHPFGASLALKLFFDVSVELASSEAAEPSYKLPEYEVPSPPSMEDVNYIKMEAVRQMKLGNPDMAVELLRGVYEWFKNEPQSAYYLEMALVEILIYQGRYEEALNFNCLKDEPLIQSDARVPLYKAIICTMLNKEEAINGGKNLQKPLKFDPSSC